MAAAAKDNVSYRLLNRLSNLVICSRCLRAGKVTSHTAKTQGRRRQRAKLLTLRR
jgi:hypothetical protein